MRIGTAAAVLALVCLSTVPSSVFAKKDHVLVISGEAEFEKAVKDNPFLVVEFFAPWCGHCKKLAPEWEKAAKSLKGGEPAITLASVDATEEPNKVLAEKYGIKGFPTIKMFRDGDAKSPIDYDGPREADGIVSTLKKQSGPAVKPLAAAAAVKEFRTLSSEREVVVVGVFPEGDASEEAAAFRAVASALRTDYEFGLVTDAALLPEAKGAKGSTILLLKSFDEPVTTYGGKLEKKALRDWVELAGSPTYAILDQNPKNRRAIQKVFADPKAKILAFGDAADKAWAPVKEAFVAASKALASEYNFIVVENAGNDGALDYFGLKAPDTPAFVIHDQGNDAKFVSKNVGAGALVPWLEEFKGGKLVKAIKSEEAPVPNDAPVTVLTANNFDEIVTLGKNVMIEFYAPWCGHCKSLAPAYEKVGEAFKDDPTVVVAKMDATANDIKDSKKFPVKGFPTLMFVTADGKVSTFDGDRTEEGLIEYIKSHSDSVAKDGEASKDEL